MSIVASFFILGVVAQQLLFRSQFDYADSRYSYVRNLLRLKQVAGTLDEADVSELATFNDASDPVRDLAPQR